MPSNWAYFIEAVMIILPPPFSLKILYSLQSANNPLVAPYIHSIQILPGSGLCCVQRSEVIDPRNILGFLWKHFQSWGFCIDPRVRYDDVQPSKVREYLLGDVFNLLRVGYIGFVGSNLRPRVLPLYLGRPFVRKCGRGFGGMDDSYPSSCCFRVSLAHGISNPSGRSE